MSFTGLVFACGGMTQINPPSLQLDAEQSGMDCVSLLQDLERKVSCA